MFARSVTSGDNLGFSKCVSSVVTCLLRCRVSLPALLGVIAAAMATACASAPTAPVVEGPKPPGVKGYTAETVVGPMELKLKAQPKETEVVDYYHISASRAFEGQELRHEKTDVLEFTAQADTVKIDRDQITQAISVTRKEGKLDLHDFAMPEPGERLEISSAPDGKILKAGDWPPNSIFYVPPVSLPKGTVEVGDTWVMQSSWLSLEDMVPYQLDMVSILKGYVKCGVDVCADIELNGDVSMQGGLQKTIVFRSEWRGRMLFAVAAGTVVWSRVNSDETFAYDRVYRTVGSCLEATLRIPERLTLSAAKPGCEGFAPPVSTLKQ